MDKIQVFIHRLDKIGIKVELGSNVPWVYLCKINGKVVTEKYLSEYKFTLAFIPIRTGKELRFTNISEIFKLLRKYCLYPK